MNKLLSILIFFSFMSVSTAEETYLRCWSLDELTYEVSINFERRMLWVDSNKYNITVFTDKTIIAHRHEEKETAQIVINRYTGELVQGFDKSGDNIIDVKIRLNCKPLEQKF